MKKTIIILFLFIFTVSFANGLIAEEESRYTGNYFYSVLAGEKPDNYFSEGAVTGYIAGISDAFDGIIWEFPSGMNYEQIKDIVKNHLEAHPETRHKHIRLLIIRALKEKLPKAENPKEQLATLLFLAGRDELK